MPIPKPKPDESRNDYIGRCMEAVSDEFDDNEQAVAVCNSTWEEARKRNMNVNSQLLAAIKERRNSQTEFNYGILTADRYVKTLQECVGSDLCYRYAAKGNVSYNDILKKAAETLTYNNPDMKVLDSVGQWEKQFKQDSIFLGDTELEVPKHTLMVIKHVLTTPRKDRDGDILRTSGAKPDPKMLMLWQHVHTLPIGKMLGIAEHTSNKLALYSAIVDMNELAHDAAVMIDNEMGRFSHGFRALEFDKIKEDEGDTTSPGGFDVKSFEIMEESLVSVPSNVDAETEEVMLSLIEDGKMTSPMMKTYGKSIREHRPKQFNVPVNLDLNVRINGKDVNANQPRNGSGSAETKGAGKEGCACGGTPKETDGKAGKEGTPTDEKMLIGGFIDGSWEDIEHKLRDKAGPYLKERGITLDDDAFVFLLGTFADHAIVCIERMHSEPEYYKLFWRMENGEPEFNDAPKQVDIEHSTEVRERINRFYQAKSTKAGRVISRRNLEKLTDVKEDMDEIEKQHVSTRSGVTLVRSAKGKVQEIIDEASMDNDDDNKRDFGVDAAITKVIADADQDQRNHLMSVLKTIDDIEKRQKASEKFRALVAR